jgi:hypothetical protein
MSKKWTPDAEQLLGVRWLVQHQEAALFLSPGSGKTSITYAAITILKKEKLFNGALVIAPLRPATMTWPNEQQEWTDFHGLDVVVLHGKYKDKLAEERHDVYIINYEAIQWLVTKHIKNLLAKKWIDIIVFDELTKMKNASRKAMRRKLLLPWLPRFERRWGLTGSPAANGLINIFGQVNVLDLGKAFGVYVTHFRNQFFNPVGMWGWVLKEGAESLIYDRLRPLALRTELGKGVKIPELRMNDIRVDLPTHARRAYEEMEAEMLTILNDDTVAAGSASAVYGKCCQIASGAVFKSLVDPVTGEALHKGGSREWHAVHEEKLDALEELIEEIQGQQILVAYWYRHSLERLQKRFGKDMPYIGSGVSIKRAKEIEAEWNAGNIPILFGHPASISHGVNFQESSAYNVCWFDLTPDQELFDQFNRRLCRRGNKAPHVFVHRIVATRTVEAWGILPSLSRKEKTQNNLFIALRKLARKV